MRFPPQHQHQRCPRPRVLTTPQLPSLAHNDLLHVALHTDRRGWLRRTRGSTTFTQKPYKNQMGLRSHPSLFSTRTAPKPPLLEFLN